MDDASLGDIQVPLLTNVTLPDGSQYQPTPTGYLLQSAGAGNCVNGSASLQHMTLPVMGTLPQGWNRYAYARNNPVKFFDQTATRRSWSSAVTTLPTP
jgi:hypothetical protein